MTALLIIGIVVLGIVFVARSVVTAPRRNRWTVGRKAAPTAWSSTGALDFGSDDDDGHRSHTHHPGGAHDHGGVAHDSGSSDSGGGDSGGSSGDS